MISATFRYLGALVLLLLCYVGGIFLFPIAYLLRKWKDYYPLWWWFDDEDGIYGAEYWRKANNITKKNFWIAYRWAGLRNPMWNAHTKIEPKSGEEKHIKSYGYLTQNNKEVNLINSAVFFYENKDGTWGGNTGDLLSTKYSYLGWSFYIFKKQNVTYWRFSFAKQLIGPLGLELQLGAFHRYIFKIKLKWHTKIK